MVRTGRPVEHTDTTIFAQWMAEMKLTNAAAAELLDLSQASIKAYKSGRAGAFDGIEPDRRTLLAMAAIKAGIEPYEPVRKKESAGAA